MGYDAISRVNRTKMLTYRCKLSMQTKKNANIENDILSPAYIYIY